MWHTAKSRTSANYTLQFSLAFGDKSAREAGSEKVNFSLDGRGSHTAPAFFP